jgi:PKD repeat protein
LEINPHIMNLSKIFLFSCVFLTFLSCRKQPKADAKSNKLEVEINEVIHFTNLSSNGKSFVWDFGDGTTSTETSPSKSYSQSGSYSVTMTAYSKNEKKKDVKIIYISVINENQKFLGEYSGVYTVTDGVLTDTFDGNLLILAGENSDEITIKVNGNTIYGSVVDTEIIIPEQTVTIGNSNFHTSGEGTLNGKTIVLDFVMSFLQAHNYYTFIGSK